MGLYRDDAVVLRVQKLGEADRIISLLTRRYGRVRAVAKGVRKTSSRFGARLEPFSHVDLQLYEGRSLDVVSQAEGITPYGKDIMGHYGRYTAASAVLETAERLTAEEREPSLRLYLLTLGALRVISSGEHDAPLGAGRVPAPRDGHGRLVARAAGVRGLRPLRRAPLVLGAGRRLCLRRLSPGRRGVPLLGGAGADVRAAQR